MMNRRDFLGLFAAASAAVGLGIAPASKPRGPYSIRYLEAYDEMRGQMVHRLDIAHGMKLEVPRAIQRGIAYENVSESQVADVIRKMGREVSEIPKPEVISAALGNLPKGSQIMGVSW